MVSSDITKRIDENENYADKGELLMYRAMQKVLETEQNKSNKTKVILYWENYPFLNSLGIIVNKEHWQIAKNQPLEEKYNVHLNSV